MRALAAELIDQIIDCLREDPSSLRSCALVRQSWLARSRYHLFKEIHLFHDAYNNKTNCTDLYAILQRSPNIASVIQNLHIEEGQASFRNQWIKTTPSLPSLLDLLTHLTVLKFHCIQWDDHLPTLLRSTLRTTVASNPITSLAFRDCVFSGSSFLRTLCSCHHLKCLAIRDSHYTSSLQCTTVLEEEATGPDFLQCHIQLHELRTDYSRQTSPLEDLVIDPETGVSLCQLHTLYCGDTLPYQSVLNTAGGSLRHLFIRAVKMSSRISITFDKVSFS
jgi:hypothetical protein